MIKYNYHTHTYRCGHASGEDEDYVIEAIKAGYKELGFSDHAAYVTSNPSQRMEYNQVNEYIASIRSLQKKYQDKISILIGMEVEYFPSQMDDLSRYRRMLDYCILGQHCQECDSFSNYDCKIPAHVESYAHSVTTAMRIGLCDIVAHPDIFMFSYPAWDDACDKATKEICEASLKYDIPLELNCGGVQYGKMNYQDGERYAYPVRKFWQIVEAYKCKVIIGLDLHNPRFISNTSRQNATLEIVKGLKLNYIETFDIKAAANKRKLKFNNDKLFTREDDELLINDKYEK